MNIYDALVFVVGIPLTMAACVLALTVLRRAV